MPSAKPLGLLFVLSLASAYPAAAMPPAVDFRDDRWVHADPAARVVEHRGAPSLFVRSGTSYLRGAAMEDGIVEVDVAPAGERGFAGVVFRVLDAGELEEVYVRFHKSGLPDALQYTPRFHGSAAWQLYSGPGFTSPATFRRDGWTHLKVHVEGTEARVYVDGADRPALVVTDLKREPGEGAVGVWALGGAYFADFRYTPLPRSLVPREERREAPAGVLSRWEISQAFETREVSPDRYPSAELAARLRWDRVGAEPEGIVNLSRFRAHSRAGSVPEEGSEDVVFARTTLSAARAGMRKLVFGYSDRVTVFLNGRPVFSGNSAFRSRDPAFLGIVGLGHDAVYLELREGENELMLAVADRSGGWGFVAQVVDAG